MIKSFSSIVGMLVVTQAYAINPAAQKVPQEIQELRDELTQEWTKQQALENKEWRNYMDKCRSLHPSVDDDVLESYARQERRNYQQDIECEQHLKREQQLKRQAKYLEEHPDCKNKFDKLQPKLIGLLELADYQENGLKRSLSGAKDEEADAYREALLALDATSFDNPSKAIQEQASKVRYLIGRDGNRTVSYLLALLKMLKNKTPINE